MKEFGIRFSGLEQPLEEILIDHIKDKNQYTFLEIGFASGKTHKAIREIIKENINTDFWMTIGLDLINSDNVNFKEINQIFNENELLVYRPGDDDAKLASLGKYHSVLTLRENPREDFIKNIDDNGLDLCLIDANHSLTNTYNDFIAIENKMVPGSLVLFHDAGIEETGSDFQCVENGVKQYIDVRGALIKLGLLGDHRKGWRLIQMIPGTRHLNKNPDGGNSLAVFQKI